MSFVQNSPNLQYLVIAAQKWTKTYVPPPAGSLMFMEHTCNLRCYRALMCYKHSSHKVIIVLHASIAKYEGSCESYIARADGSFQVFYYFRVRVHKYSID